MDLFFLENHLLLQKRMREFARNKLAPVADKLDQAGESAWIIVKAMA